MKHQLNEVKRLQKIAGILKEDSQVSEESTSIDFKSPNEEESAIFSSLYEKNKTSPLLSFEFIGGGGNWSSELEDEYGDIIEDSYQLISNIADHEMIIQGDTGYDSSNGQIVFVFKPTQEFPKTGIYVVGEDEIYDDSGDEEDWNSEYGDLNTQEFFGAVEIPIKK